MRSKTPLLLASLGLAVLSMLALTVALALPGSAHASNGHGGKVGDRLAAVADSLPPDADLDVIIASRTLNGNGNHYGQLRHTNLSIIGGGYAERIKVRDLDTLAADPAVDFISYDAPVTPTGIVDPSQLTTLYPFADKVDRAAWGAGLDGSGVGLAVVDSGVAPLADFGSRLSLPLSMSQTWPNVDLVGHGSLVAGIAAGKSADGKFIGIAPGAKVFGLDVNNPGGPHSSDVIDALQWVFDNAHAYNIRVVNLSLSETVPSVYTQSTLDLAVERLWAAGIAVVVSAGNLGVGANTADFAPANDPLALTVGSTDTNGTRDTSDDLLAAFTSVGATVSGFFKPELLAPGRLIASTLPAGTSLDLQAPAANRVAPGYATISGTSFSAPQVAGAAAILFQQHPDWSPDNVKWVLVQKSRLVLGTTVPTLAIDKAVGTGVPGLANQGVPALVCAPGTACVTGTTVASSWNSSSWNSSSWNSSSWNSSSWNSSSWNSSSWNRSSWNSSSWNSSSWNSSSWNSSSWNSSSWNSFSWN